MSYKKTIDIYSENHNDILKFRAVGRVKFLTVNLVVHKVTVRF
jgi:hypothetical protein